ncbi:MAG TPA: sensor histidine kinase [Candidatus Sulfotelmatobacter sp.]|nr:sensor histidine kinase [Candidatus Sulfotelmatobacter sp.]
MWISKHLRLSQAHSELEKLISERTAELQRLSQRLLTVQDEERRKIARDLHDSTGQTLAALKISLSLLHENCMDAPATLAMVSDVAQLADQAIGEIRTMSYLLHPPLLDEVGFACAAEWYIEGFAKRSGIEINADIVNSHARLPKRIEMVLFRVLQESLTNVHRHSGASKASIQFQHGENAVILEVRDFGKGIPEERLQLLSGLGAGTGVGLAGMRERLLELNGRLEIESDTHGTTMRAIVPFSALTTFRQLGDCCQNDRTLHSQRHAAAPGCCICNSPVPLETSNTDENGQAVHEECYVLKVCAATELLADRASISGSANRPSIIQPCEAKMPAGWESLKPPTPPDPLQAVLMPQAKRFPRHRRSWNLDAAAFAIVLVSSCWIAYSGRHTASSAGSFEMRRASAVDEQVSLPAANTMLAEYKPTVQTVAIPAEEAKTAKPHRRAWLAEQEVVHIGEDVTVRYFTAKPAPHRASAGQHQVVHMGEDVTVRYFTSVGRNTTN